MQYDGSSYDRMRGRHTFHYDSYVGGDRYRAPSRTTLSTATAWAYGPSTQDANQITRTAVQYSSYLVPHTAESNESFECRLQRACYLNIVAPIVDSYAEGVTAEVSREIPDSFGDMLDVDLRGSSWGDHAEEVARWATLYGYVATVFDAPAKNQAQNRAEEQAAGHGPRAVIVHPTAFAWLDVDDDGRLETFAYVEQAFVDDTTTVVQRCRIRVRVWTKRGGPNLDTPSWEVREGVVSVGGGSGIAAQRDAFGELLDSGPLPAALNGELPVVFAYYRRLSQSRYPLGQSLVDDACDVARSIYNKLSEEDEIHVKAGFPFLALPMASTGGQLDPQTAVAVGPGRGLGYNATTGAPQYVQPSSESSKELRESIVFRVAVAFRLCGIEVATDQSGQAESGVALRVRARGFENRAKRFASAMSRYERQGLKLWGALAGSGEEAIVEYPKRFTLPDPSEDLANALLLLKELPVEMGVEAKLGAVRKAIDAVLNLSDEEMTEILTEIRGYLEQDVEESNKQRDARMSGLANAAEKQPSPPVNDASNEQNAAGDAATGQPEGADESAPRPGRRLPPPNT
jgi:hypothetical protein